MTATTTAARVSRWSRRYVLAGAVLLVAWQAGALAGLGRRATVALALYGFVAHVVVGKGYALVPTYFARELAVRRAPAVGFPALAVGAVALAAGTVSGAPGWLSGVGALAWTLGAAVFVAAIGWTVRDNLAGRETGTGEHEIDRRAVDRFANLFVPVALAYLLVAAWTTVAGTTALPGPLDGYPPRASHLLAAGTAVLLVLAIGARLLPRLLVATPPRRVLRVALPAGATGPALLAVGVGGARSSPVLAAGAALETVAVAGFAVVCWTLFVRSDRRRVGVYGILAATVAGLVGVALGLWLLLAAPTAALVRAHLRANLLGLVGLTIVGLSYQFYPPSIGAAPWSSDRVAAASIACLAGGLGCEVAGVVVRVDAAIAAGGALTLAGSLLYGALLASAFRAA